MKRQISPLGFNLSNVFDMNVYFLNRNILTWLDLTWLPPYKKAPKVPAMLLLAAWTKFAQTKSMKMSVTRDDSTLVSHHTYARYADVWVNHKWLHRQILKYYNTRYHTYI